MKIARALPVVSIVFVTLYAWGVFVQNTFLWYYPKIALWHWGRLPRSPAVGIPSQWYGWMGNAIVGALIVGAIYLLIPRRLIPRTWSGWSWVVPIAMFPVVIYVIAKNFWLPKP